MKYMGDRDWWDNRFRVRELSVMKHEKCLEEDIAYFPREGKILDVACGDGRNAIYLARLGYKVLAIDFSEEALNRLKYFIKKERLAIETRLVDLSRNDVFVNLEKFDGIIINHYRLSPQLYGSLMNHINKDGVLWVNGFNEIPNDNPNISASDIIQENDFITLDKYILVSKKLYEISQSKYIRLIWKKHYNDLEL